MIEQKRCCYPACECPCDAPYDPDGTWCARGLARPTYQELERMQPAEACTEIGHTYEEPKQKSTLLVSLLILAFFLSAFALGAWLDS